MGLSFVLCFAAQRTVLGCVVTQEGSRMDVLAPDGIRYPIKAHQVLLHWEHRAAAPPGDRPEDWLSLLREKSAWLQERASRLPLAALAERLPKGERLLLETIAEALDAVDGNAGAAAESPEWNRAALCLALIQDRDRFRREGTGFVALDPREKGQRQARKAQADEEEQWARLARQWGPDLARGHWSGSGSPQGREFLARLRSLAAHERHSPYWVNLGKALGLHQRGEASVTHRLKPWLDAAGAWPGWPALWLERAGVRQAFPRDALNEAARIAALEVDLHGRSDRRGETVYTVDAASTFDYDDAYSLETNGGADLVVCVHIAEPHPDLAPGHAVFDEAARRMSSVYTEAGVFPMLPPALSLGRCSLISGQPREAVTFRFRVRDSGLEWCGLERSVIEVRENLDYERARLLAEEQSGTWGRLARACEAQAQDRMRRGAFLTDRVDVLLDLSDPGRVGLTLRPRSGTAQRIVEELAIAYNLVVGRYCRDAELPALYRVQHRLPPPRPGATGAQRLGIAHARFSTRGGPHAGLACERYVQSTSPNRRFPDLIMQRQIVAHAAGRPAPFSREQLADWGDLAEARLGAYEEAERFIQEHWVRVYLTQHPDQTVRGTVRRVGAKSALVWIDELALAAEAAPVRSLEAGQQRTFRVVGIDLDLQRLQVAAV